MIKLLLKIVKINKIIKNILHLISILRDIDTNNKINSQYIRIKNIFINFIKFF